MTDRLTIKSYVALREKPLHNADQESLEPTTKPYIPSNQRNKIESSLDKEFFNEDEEDDDFMHEFEDQSSEILRQEMADDYLMEHGLDSHSLQQFTPMERVNKVITLWNESPLDRGQHKKDTYGLDKDNPRSTPELDRVGVLHRYAREVITELLRNREVTIVEVLSCLDSRSMFGVQQLDELDELVRGMRSSVYPDGLTYVDTQGSLRVQNAPQLPLEHELVHAVQGLHKSILESPETNYFFSAHIPAVQARWENKETRQENDPLYGFYEIEKNLLAVINQRSIKFLRDGHEASVRFMNYMQEVEKTRQDDPEAYLDASYDHIDDMHDDTSDWNGASLLFSDDFKDVPPQDIAGYVQMLQPETRQVIESDFGITLNTLTIREQLHFLDYLKETSLGTAATMKSFISHYGIDAMRSFLSLAQTEGLTGDEIIGFGIGIEESLVKEVFTRYAAVLDTVNNISQVVSSYTEADHAQDSETQAKIAAALTKRVNQFFAKAVRAGSGEGVLASLDQFLVEGAIFAATARTLYEQGDFKLDDMRNTELAIETGALSEQDAEVVRNLYTTNYNHPRFKTFLPAVLEKFNESTKQQDATWYLLRHEGKVIGSARFLPQVDTEGKLVSKHFGAFNVNQAFGNGKLGEAMFMEFIAAEAKAGVPINAECVPDSPIAAKYIESGFVGTHMIEFGGVPLMCITYDPNAIDTELLAVSAEDLVQHGWNGTPVREITEGDTFPEFTSGSKLRRSVTYQGKKYGLFI